MIESFKHRGLKDLFETGKSAKVPPDMRKRIKARLDVIHAARTIPELNQPGYHLHQLTPMSVRWSIWVTGAWRITFLWHDGKAIDVDLEQYH
jgi:proteic killer suppression protein